MGLCVHLSIQQSAKLSFLSRIFKKEIKELKNYSTELGFRLEACKTKDRESGLEIDDFLVCLKSNAAFKPEKSEEPKKSETTKKQPVSVLKKPTAPSEKIIF